MTTLRDPATRSWAVLSDDGRYRYRLGRRWADDGACDVWVMLNPSTADALVDDPTIRRCAGFSKSWGAAGIVVVNLFALRATNPAELYVAEDPVGPDNDDHITRVVETASWEEGRVIVAWGAHPAAVDRSQEVRAMLEEQWAHWSNFKLLSLGRTQSGAPRHPLYLPGTAVPVPWAR